MPSPAGVVIVGASLAGLTTAEGLRSEGYTGPITLIGEEDRLPYNRPPLSKHVLAGARQIDGTTLRDPVQMDALGVRHLRGRRANSVDIAAQVLTVDGDRLSYDHLVAATGVAARRLPNPRAIRGIHSLRTADDALAIHEGLRHAAHVAIVGAGVLGCEIASGASKAGRNVTLIGRSSGFRFGQTGGHLSPMITELMHANGVRLRMGVDVVAVDGSETVSAVQLSDGSVVPTDMVVAAIGCTPSIDWLSGTGIDTSDGVLCDANGVAAPGVYAVGDVARWFDRATGAARRIEHQAAAIEQAFAVARLITSGETTDPIAAFFWSEIFGNRNLVHGRLEADLPVTVLAAEVSENRFVAATIRNGRPTGLVGWNMPREFRLERARLMQQSQTTAASDSTLKGSIVA